MHSPNTRHQLPESFCGIQKGAFFKKPPFARLRRAIESVCSPPECLYGIFFLPTRGIAPCPFSFVPPCPKEKEELWNLIIEWKKVLYVRAGEYELSQSDNRLHLRNWYEHSENTHRRGDHWSPACKAHRLTSGRGDPSPTKRYSFYNVIRFHSRFFFVSVGAKKKLSKETPKTRGNFLKKVSSGLLQKLSGNCRRDVRRAHPKQCVSLQAAVEDGVRRDRKTLSACKPREVLTFLLSHFGR